MDTPNTGTQTLTVKVAPDREDCIYRAGDTATMAVSAVNPDGSPAREGVLHMRLDNYGERVFAERDVDLSGEPSVVLPVSRATPGFARLTVESRTPGIVVAENPGNAAGLYRFGIAFSPGDIRPAAPFPDDFESFWRNAVRKLDETVPVDARMEAVPERSAGPCLYYRVSFASHGGRRVYGWLSVPKAPGRHAVRVRVPGAGIGSLETTVEPDRVNLTMNVHSYRQPEGDTPEAAAERQRLYDRQDAEYGKANGTLRYCQGGIHKGREEYFYYASLLGINRAVDWLAAQPWCDPDSFGYYGTSQGGGFGLMLTAINGHFTGSCIFVPAITDLLGSRIEGRQSGWPGIIENQAPENRAAAEKWAPYYDGANFARLIRCPIRFVVGFCDMACPPHAVYSAYNVCASRDKAIVHGIGMGHRVFERFYQELDKWPDGRRAKRANGGAEQ